MWMSFMVSFADVAGRSPCLGTLLMDDDRRSYSSYWEG